MRLLRSTASLLTTAVLCCAAVGLAETPDEALRVAGPDSGPAPIVGGVPNLNGLLFVGTSQNSSDPTATLNDVFTVDPVANTSNSILMNTGVWGATADPANQRILFTRSSGAGFGDELWQVPYGGGTPTSLGSIVDGVGAPRRIDGLAMSGGVLYGSVADAVSNGLYSIDLGSLVATQLGTFSDSISGIDADPATGTIYGTNDSTLQLVSIALDGTLTNVAAYPAGFVDIDGLAIGNGLAYLITDESQDISVYDLVGGVYTTPLTSPFASADIFSAGAYAVGGGPTTPVIEVPTMSPVGMLALVLLLGGLSFVAVRRRRQVQG